jgi:hypothetical protein
MDIKRDKTAVPQHAAAATESAALEASSGEQDDSLTFELDASEEELLEEFGVLMAAEYNYGLTRDSASWVLPPDVIAQIPAGERVLPPASITLNISPQRDAKLTPDVAPAAPVKPTK